METIARHRGMPDDSPEHGYLGLGLASVPPQVLRDKIPPRDHVVVDEQDQPPVGRAHTAIARCAGSSMLLAQQRVSPLIATAPARKRLKMIGRLPSR